MILNFAAVLLVLFAFGGIAVDTGLLELQSLQLQNAADAAALGAANELARGNSAWSDGGSAEAKQNGFTNGQNTVVSFSNPPTGGHFKNDALAVQANITVTTNTVMMGLVSSLKPSVTSTAVARVMPTCLYVMDAAPSAQTVYLASAGFRTVNCGAYINSKTYSAIVDGFGVFATTRARVVGPASGGYSYGYVSPPFHFNSTTRPDPLAYVTSPAFVAPCTYTNTSLTSVTTTLNPGTYCGGITINGGTVAFNPGLYIVTGGISWTNNAVITGSGVTFYLTSGGGYTAKQISISNSTLRMSAPNNTYAGGIPGVIFFTDRNWTPTSSNNYDVTIASSSVQTDGIWYCIGTGLYEYNSNLYGNKYMCLVVRYLNQFFGNIWGSADFSAVSGPTPLHYFDSVLVQ